MTGDKDSLLVVVDSLLALNGKCRVSGRSLRPLFSHVVMDRVLQIFCKHIKTAPLRHKQAKLRGQWRGHYNEFNMRGLFSYLDNDQTDLVVDLMDGLESVCDKPIKALYVALETICRPHCGNYTEVVIWCLIADIFTKVANAFWEMTFKAENPVLSNLQKTIVKLMRECYRGVADIKTNSDKVVGECVSVLVSTMTDFQIELDREKEK